LKNKFLLIMTLVGVIAISAIVGLVGSGAAAVVSAEGQPITVNVGNQPAGISVSGLGKVTVTPDIAAVSLGVSAQSSTVAEAQSQASTAMDKVIAALTSNGVAKNDIRTQYFNIQQLSRWDEKQQQSVLTGYMVSNMVTAKVRTVDKTGSIIDAVAVAGGDNTRVNGVSFSVEKPEQYYIQAREKAVEDAKARAKQLADIAGVTLGKATYISESSYTPYTPYLESYKAIDMAGGSSAPVTSISPGETDITMNVQINYAIQ
jgi:uncharacterized protein YggE